MDFTKLDRDQQRKMLLTEIVNHVKRFPESVIAIEEYEKIHCDTRIMLRQLFQNPEVIER